MANGLAQARMVEKELDGNAMTDQVQVGEAVSKETAPYRTRNKDCDLSATLEQQWMGKQVSCTSPTGVEIWPGLNIAVEPNNTIVQNT